MTTLEVNRIISAPIDEVFAALTDAAVMSRWFFHEADGSAQIEMNPVVGGAYSIAMRGGSGDELTSTGEFREVRSPHRLVFTWNTYLITDAVVSIDLEAVGDATRLTLHHELPSKLHGPHRVAWEAVFDNLDELLS